MKMEATFGQLHDALNVNEHGTKWHAEMSGALICKIADRIVILSYLPDFYDDKTGWSLDQFPLSLWDSCENLGKPMSTRTLPGVDCRELDDASRTALAAWANEMAMQR